MGWLPIFMFYSLIIFFGLILTKYVNFNINWQEFYDKRRKQSSPKFDIEENNIVEMTNMYKKIMKQSN